METKKIAVIGLGLIGGSILKGLQGKGYELLGIARREETINQALEEKLIVKGSTKLEICSEADIVFICTPISKVIDTINKLSSIIKPDAIITDVASLKGDIMNHVNKTHPSMKFIGGHPLAGTEHKGLEASLAELFVDARWVLTPPNVILKEDIQTLNAIIEQLGAKIITADPVQHDKAVALISHMPLLLSQGLFGMVDTHPNMQLSELSMKLASSGFRDMTRLAATNPELAKDMLCENKTNVIEAVKELQEYLSRPEKKLVEDEETFVKITEKLACSRKKMYSSDGKNLL